MAHARHASMVVLFLLTAQSARAETPLEAANRAFAEQRWQAAADMFQELAVADEANFVPALRAGASLVQLGRPREALGWLEKAEQRGAPAAAVGYRKGAAYAALGDREAAIRELRRAVAAGLPTNLEADPLLLSLHGSPELAAVALEQDRRRRPCRHDPRYRAFDYWIGEWDVVANGAPAGSPVSDNVLTLEYDGCVLQEHWTAAGGGTGSSFNIFDASRGKWYQTWVDSSGGLHEYSGNPDAEGNLEFHAELAPPQGDGPRVPTRLRFIKMSDRQVRQLSESSTDGGKTWTINYDFIYSRRAPKPAPAAP